MPQIVRKVAVTLLFGVLILAFAIQFGGNFSFQRLGGHSYVAKVGSLEISPQAYKNAYDRLIENISMRAKQRITQAQARAYGLPQQALQGLIQETLLTSEATQLGLGLSLEGLGNVIRSNPAFQDASGKFDAAKYQLYLRNRGYNEAYFQHELTQDLVRQQIQGIFASSGVVPTAMADAYNRYLNGLRTISYFTLTANAAGTIEAPSEDALKSFYEDHKTQFMAPEFRKVAVLAVTQQTVQAGIAITDEEVKAKYDAQPGNYAVPERRKISLIPFKTKAAADAADAALASGKGFDDIAKAAGFQTADTNIGTVSKAELGQKFDSNSAILEAAFSLKKGKISKPIDGPLSWVILRVEDITAGKEESFDTVKAGIRESMLKAKSTEESSKLVTKLEEERAAGISLQDIAKKLNLKIEEVTLDHKGNGMDGKPVALGAPAAAVADGAFKSDPGVENDALRLQGGGYAWYDVLDVVKARQKPFDEVKADVEAGWKKEQIRAKLAGKARELVDRLSRGDKIADVAKSAGATVKTTQPIKRDASEAGLPQSAIAQAFSLAENAAASAQGGDGESRAIFQVTKVAQPGPLNPMQAKQLEQQLSSQIAEDNFVQYLSGLEKTIGVTVDRKNFATVLGGGSVDEGE
jgi:peptidyl-prolyl cis-trans isomerase D